MAAPVILNFNVGVLGHVDSGKTSLARALSTTASTAAFDKNPQSKERGITLDLGFSSFQVDFPDSLKTNAKTANACNDFEKLQFTLVDCPGHASLIKTIIGGCQIIDLMLLVVDVVKGMQTQTAECLVIGQLTCPKLIVVLNKVDLLPTDKRDTIIEKMKRKMSKTLESTCFKDAPMVCVAAKPGGGGDAVETSEMEGPAAVGIDALVSELTRSAYLPVREHQGPFVFAVDHCFSIRGQGTVMTGTVLSGTVRVNDTVELPSLQTTRKVKSLQMYRSPVESARQGDRVGVCVTQFDARSLERGVMCTPGALPTIHAALATVHKIAYFRGQCLTKAKFHISIGHETVMARVTFFGHCVDKEENSSDRFDFDMDYHFQEELVGDQEEKQTLRQYCLLELDKAVPCPPNCLVLGSKLDADIHANACRLAFHGHLVTSATSRDYTNTLLPRLKVYKEKRKEGIVDRCHDDRTVIVRSLFKKESSSEKFVGLKVELSTGEIGTIQSSFGQSGKLKIDIPDSLKATTKERLAASSKKKTTRRTAAESTPATDGSGPNTLELGPVKVFLNFKRYVYDPHKKMVQDSS